MRKVTAPMKIITVLLLSISVYFLHTFAVFAQSGPRSVVSPPHISQYDMREELTPPRLTIAMWDYSWLNGHYPGGAFDDFDKVTDDLLERGFNTVRIDAFPFIIHDLHQKGESDYFVKANPLLTWGLSEKDHTHDMPGELIEFMAITKKKGIYVILSSWGVDAKDYKTRDTFFAAWETTLDLLQKRALLSHVLFVDLDQEFPNFSPFLPEIYSLSPEVPANTNAFYRQWNDKQMTFLKDHIDSLLLKCQRQYPELRFTFSLVTNLDQFREMNLTNLDVLEIHTWIDLKRFDARTGFFSLKQDRDPQNDYTDYMRRVTATMNTMRPMLLENMHNQLSFVQNWSLELGAPLVTTEAFGPWWHMDHPDLDWKWLYDWCEQGMALSSQYGFWGSTPWNFSHPYWENWSNVEWYKKLNKHFIDN